MSQQKHAKNFQILFIKGVRTQVTESGALRESSNPAKKHMQNLWFATAKKHRMHLDTSSEDKQS